MSFPGQLDDSAPIFGGASAPAERSPGAIGSGVAGSAVADVDQVAKLAEHDYALRSVVGALRDLTMSFKADREERRADADKFSNSINKLSESVASQRAASGKVSGSTVVSVLGLLVAFASVFVAVGRGEFSHQAEATSDVAADLDEHELLGGHPEVTSRVDRLVSRVDEYGLLILNSRDRLDEMTRDLAEHNSVVAGTNATQTAHIDEHRRRLERLTDQVDGILSTRMTGDMGLDLINRVSALEVRAERLEDEQDYRRPIVRDRARHNHNQEHRP